jgi:hypothetical protein
MTFRYWLLIAAIGGCVIGTPLGKGSAQDNASPAAQQPQKQESGAQPAAPNQDKPEQAAEPDHYKVKCDRPKDHDAADLCEQRRMAKAAEDAVWWAEFQTKLGIAGFVSVLCSLVFTGWAAFAAGEAAKAAKASTEISREALISTERAFAFMERINSTPVQANFIDSYTVSEWHLQPQWRNTGKTATVRAVNCINVWNGPSGIADGPEAEAFTYPDYGSAEAIMLAPGAEMHGLLIKIPVDQLREVRAETRRIFVWGWIEYDDVFAETARHRSQFCMKLEVIGDPAQKGEPFKYRLHGPFNGFDLPAKHLPTEAN